MIDTIRNSIRRMLGKKEYAGSYGSALQRIANMPGGSPRQDTGKMLDMYGDHTWVYACIRVIQTKGAGVPLKVYRTEKGKPVVVENHPLQKLLDSVNPFMNGYDLRESTHGYIELTGNCYWLKDKMVGGVASELSPLIPTFVKPIITATGLTSYEYWINGIMVRKFALEEIVHFRTWDPCNPFIGIPALLPARDQIDALLNANRYEAAFFRNGAQPSGILTSDSVIDEPDRQKMESAWKKMFQGAGKAFKTAILGGGLKWQSTAVSHSDMLLTDLKKMSIRDILAAFNVQPVMLGIHDDSNYSNAKEQRRAFWIDCMMPRLKKVESVINERLAPDFDSSIYVAHDLSGVEDLQEDQKTKAERDEIYTRSGIKTINEVRIEQGLEPVSWGDTWNAPIGLLPIESHAEPTDPTPAAAPNEDPADDNSKSLEQPIANVLALVDKLADTFKEETPVPEDPNKLRRDKIWQSFKMQTESVERRWYPVLRRLFSSQEKEVVQNMRNQDWEAHSRQLLMDNMENFRTKIQIILFDRTHSRKVFRKEGLQLMEFALSQKAKEEIEQYALGIDFNLYEPRVVAWLREKAFKFADEVNQTTESALRKTLEEAVKAGESISDVEKRIADVFDIARGSRTQTIARTEVISASNKGAFEAYKQSNVVEKVEWISTRDEKVRDLHQIDGEAVDVGAKFSNGLQFPGDPAGDAANVINCRCGIAPITKKGD
jgi:HK97 family phage portal protein